jgi:hypothetical protein
MQGLGRRRLGEKEEGKGQEIVCLGSWKEEFPASSSFLNGVQWKKIYFSSHQKLNLPRTFILDF